MLDRFCGGPQSGTASDRIEAAAVAARTDFHRYYRDLEDLLRSDGRMQALLEILYGPQVTATQDDAERLLREGLIRVADDSYRSFSDHFGDYLRLVGRRSDFWQSWLETENALREVVETTLVGMHGTDWVPGVRRTRPKLADMLDKCAEMQQREQRAFGDWASTRLLDFTYPQNLYELMAAHWDVFGKLLGHDKRYWSDRFQLLSKVRNPMAHNRMLAVVTPAERDLFASYCAEILGILAASDAPSPA
ncbi:Swt1 family HEPN domain-containing protein [Micromonospora sp. M12]